MQKRNGTNSIVVHVSTWTLVTRSRIILLHSQYTTSMHTRPHSQLQDHPGTAFRCPADHLATLQYNMNESENTPPFLDECAITEYHQTRHIVRQPPKAVQHGRFPSAAAMCQRLTAVHGASEGRRHGGFSDSTGNPRSALRLGWRGFWLGAARQPWEQARTELESFERRPKTPTRLRHVLSIHSHLATAELCFRSNAFGPSEVRHAEDEREEEGRSNG